MIPEVLTVQESMTEPETRSLHSLMQDESKSERTAERVLSSSRLNGNDGDALRLCPRRHVAPADTAVLVKSTAFLILTSESGLL